MSPEKCQILSKSAFYENQMRVLWSLSLVLVGVFRLFFEFGDICLVTWWYLFGNRFQLCHQACYPCVGCRPSLSRTECSPLNQTCGAWGSLSGNWPRLGVSRTRALRTEKWWSQWSKAERWTHHTAAQINCEQLFVCLLVCLLVCLFVCLLVYLPVCLLVCALACDLRQVLLLFTATINSTSKVSPVYLGSLCIFFGLDQHECPVTQRLIKLHLLVALLFCFCSIICLFVCLFVC